MYVCIVVCMCVCVCVCVSRHTHEHAPQESKQNEITVWYMLYDLGLNKSRASKFCMAVPNIFSIITTIAFMH